MKYLLRDGDSGFKQIEGEPVLKDGPLRPWAVTGDGRVVFAEWKQQGFGLQGIFELSMAARQGKTPLKGYDKTVSLTRRREFETELARDANNHPECYRDAIAMVTSGLLTYIADRRINKKDMNVTDEIGKVIKSRCYNDTGSGRLGTTATASGLSSRDAWRAAIDTLRGNDIPKILGIQVALANVLTRTLGFDGTRKTVYDDTSNKVAPSQGYLYKWFDKQSTGNDGFLRGRQKKTGAVATSVPGLTNPGMVTTGDGPEERKRGIDEWERVEDSPFIKGIDMRNIAFGAGRSGTTGELLKTYRTFGAIDDGEYFKKYLLAIVVYLVSGGHHSCHEIFSVANLLVGSNGPQGGRDPASVSTLIKGAYVPGKYIKHLPDSYINTPHFLALKEKYYDIAMLGHLHGTFV